MTSAGAAGARRGRKLGVRERHQTDSDRDGKLRCYAAARRDRRSLAAGEQAALLVQRPFEFIAAYRLRRERRCGKQAAENDDNGDPHAGLLVDRDHNVGRLDDGRRRVTGLQFQIVYCFIGD